MKTLLVVLLFAAALLGAWWFFFRKETDEVKPESQKVEVKEHSVRFNQNVENTLNLYDRIRAALVEADTMNAKVAASEFIIRLDSTGLEEMQDTGAIYHTVKKHLSDMRTNAQAMLEETDITEMRQDFRMISENFYPFLKSVRYKGQKLYWQSCPMAFNGDTEASWISNSPEIMNPYLGKSHPQYKGTMLHCGHIKDSIQ